MYLEYLANFTAFIARSSIDLEMSITKNKEKLEHQAEMIARVQSGRGIFDLASVALLIAALSPWIQRAGLSLSINIGVTAMVCFFMWRISKWIPFLRLSFPMAGQEFIFPDTAILISMLVLLVFILVMIIIFQVWRRCSRSSRLPLDRNRRLPCLEHQPSAQVLCEGNWSFDKAGV
jgi:hypothetical protein